MQTVLRQILQFPIINFIISLSGYGVCISQLTRCVRACSLHCALFWWSSDFQIRLLDQDMSFRKFYGRSGNLITQYEAPPPLFRMLCVNDMLDHDHIQWHPPSIRPYYETGSFYHLWLVRHADRKSSIFWHPGNTPLWTCMYSKMTHYL